MAAAHFITIPCEPNTALRHKESQIFTMLLWTLCSLGLKISKLFTTLRFYERCKGFRALTTMIKCASRHLHSYEGPKNYSI